jgi:MFS-type transporter involved in bile tolerance (Atg22 family)
MGTELLAHIGVPFIVALTIVIFRAATREKPIGWENCNEMALEMAILALGATGGIFVNPNLIKHFGENNGLYSILVVMITVALAGLLVYRDRFRRGKEVMMWPALIDLFIGCLSIAVPICVIYVAR